MLTENERPGSQEKAQRQPEREKHRNEEGDKHTEGRQPNHAKDSQTGLSKDPTRKNEAQQGESDLRKRTD